MSFMSEMWTMFLQEEYQQELREARKQQELQAEYANKLKKVCSVFTVT